MDKKFLKLTKALSEDNQFVRDFANAKNIDKKFEVVKNKGFDCSIDEFKNFLNLLEKAYNLRNEVSDDEMELVSGGANMKTKLAALALLGVTVFSASANSIGSIATYVDDTMSPGTGEVKSEINLETITKQIEELNETIASLDEEKIKIENGNLSASDEEAAIRLSEIEEQIRLARISLNESLDTQEAMEQSMKKNFIENDFKSAKGQSKKKNFMEDEVQSTKEGQVKNLKGIRNLGNSCFLNTALQILANANSSDGRPFEDVFTGKMGFAIRNYDMHAYTAKNCPTLYGILLFFNSKFDESKRVIERAKMEEVIKYLNMFDPHNKIYEGYQEDSTEALQRILNGAIEELDATESDQTLSPEDRNNFKNLRDSIFLTFGFNSDDKENKLVANGFICPGQAIPEEKLNSGKSLNLEETLNTGLISGELPKNLIIQLPRKFFAKGRQIKLQNPINIPEFLNVNGKTYMIKNISMHEGGATGGHYYSYTRMGDKCYKLNDSVVEECKEGLGILDQENVRRNATNVVYELLD